MSIHLQSRTQTDLSRRDVLRYFGLFSASTLLVPSFLRATEPQSTAKPTAPTLAGAQVGYYRFKIGHLEALALHDGSFSPSLSDGPFGVGEPREKLASTLHDAFLPTDKTNIPFNILVVRIGSDLIMIDTGCGALYGSAGGRLVANLTAAGIQPEQITAVFLSHAHGDHFGGLIDTTTKEPVFKNAQFFINQKEFNFWTGSSPDLSAMPMPEETRRSFIGGAQSYLNSLKDRWHLITPGEKLFDGLEVIDAPGHTPGHVAFLFASGSEQLLHFVDIAHSHTLSFAHPEWTLAFDAQPPIAIATRKKLLDRAAAERLRVFGYHMPFPSLGHVRALNGHYEFVIEPLSIS